MIERDSLLYMILRSAATYWRVIWFVYFTACFNLDLCVHLKELNQLASFSNLGYFILLPFIPYYIMIILSGLRCLIIYGVEDAILRLQRVSGSMQRRSKLGITTLQRYVAKHLMFIMATAANYFFIFLNKGRYRSTCS